MADNDPPEDEVIADSEGETEMNLYHPGAMGPPPMREETSIFGSSPRRPAAISSISNFTTGLSNQPTYTSIASATSANTKGKKADSFIDTYPAEFENTSATIADRAKTRQRSQKRPSDVIELSSDDNFGALLDSPASKVKAKPKPKAKLKSKPVEELPTEPLGASSAAPIAQAAAQATTSRPRPRPRPIIRRPPPGPQPTHNDARAPYPPMSTPPHGPEVPIATSPVRYPGSTLPPSDLPFPVSSVSTTYNELYNIRTNDRNYSDNIPRIETIRPSRNSSESPSSDSLFGEREFNESSKGKKTGADTEAEIDELATPPRGAVMNTGGISPSKMPPPPTFFAGSSSSSVGQGRETPKVRSTNPAPFPINFDLEPPEPSLMIIDGPSRAVPAKAAPKPKKQRKSKVVDEYEWDEVDFGTRPVVLDDDDMDCDFDPKGDGSAKKKKGKEKAKPKDKKDKPPKEPKAKSKKKSGTAEAGADAEAASEITPAAEASTSVSAPIMGKQQVEVVITHKPKGKPKAKGKGKEKEQDAFKSPEFIDNSEDDMDLIGPSRKSSSDPAIVPTGPARTPSVAEDPSTTPTDKRLPPPIGSSSSSSNPSRQRPSPDSRIPVPPVDHDAVDSPMPNASSSNGKRSSGTGKKKRKSVVESDVEDDDFLQDGEDDLEVNGPESSISAPKKRKVGPSAGDSAEKGRKGKKKSTVVLSDDNSGDEPPSTSNKERAAAKSKKPTRRSVQDDEEQEEQIAELEPKSTPPESNVRMKENVKPAPLKPQYSTPKPTSVNRPSTTQLDSDAKTPLYARYEIAPRKSSLPMSELIRRANSIPGSPFATPHPSSGSSKLKPLLSSTGRTGATAYSPYMKASRSMLSRIAPLHPNRRTPPPPPPPPPPRKKSKKELEMEEKWEEEMIEDVGGMEAWAAMDDGERREMRKAKWARELGGWDD